MAIYQPSNITPSRFAGISNSIVAASDNVVIAWQVNGNSPLTAFKIELFENDAVSTAVSGYTAEIITLENGFYGTDSKGNPVFFEYAPNGVTWADWGLVDGNTYKLKITQYWGGLTDEAHTVVQYSSAVFATRSVPTLAVEYNGEAFSSGASITSAELAVTAEFSQAQGDSVDLVRWRVGSVASGADLTALTDADVQILDDTGEICTSKLAYSFSGFRTASEYAIKCEVQTTSGVIVTSGWIGFTVAYTAVASSGDLSVKRIKGEDANLITWAESVDIQGVSNVEGGYTIANGIASIADGTTLSWGTVGEEAMNFEAPYSTAWKGGVEPPTTYYGTQIDTSDLTTNVTVLTRGGNFVVALSANGNNGVLCAVGDDGELRKVYAFEDFPSGYRPTCAGFSADSTRLIVGFSPNLISTNAVLQSYTIATSGEATLAESYTLSNTSMTASLSALAISPNGEVCVVGGNIDGYCAIFDISASGSLSYKGVITKDGASLTGTVYAIAFLPTVTNGIAQCILGGNFSGGLSRFEVDVTNNTADFIEDITTAVGVRRITLSNDGSVMMVGTVWGIVTTYTISGTTFTSIGEISGLTSNEVNATAISDSNELVVIGNELYSLEDGALQFVYTLTKGADEIGEPTNAVSCGRFFIFSGDFADKLIAFYVKIRESEKVLFSLLNGGVQIKADYFAVNVYNGDTAIASVPIKSGAIEMMIAVLPTEVLSVIYGESGVIATENVAVEYTQAVISGVELYGEQTCEFVHIASGEYDYQSNGYVPIWDSATMFYANFREGLQAGTLSTTGTVTNSLYRYREGDSNQLLVYRMPTAVTMLKDYGTKSKSVYSYELFYVGQDGAYSQPVVSDTVCKQFQAYSLIEATQDEEFPDVYHVLRVFRFGSNLEAGAVSNNNSPNWLTNFTAYRLKQPTTRMGKSGTLQALLSNVNSENHAYSDTAEMQEELFKASESVNDFFLKDMKGNLYMVGISSPITQTINNKSSLQEVVVSVSWEEVGDASNVSLIQTPLDAGWNENEVTEVRVAVDTATGVLSATYPDNYTGDTFALSGAMLTATTPEGMESGEYTLEDGELTVTVG